MSRVATHRVAGETSDWKQQLEMRTNERTLITLLRVGVPRAVGVPFKRFAGALTYRTGELMGQGSAQRLSVEGNAPVWLALHGYCGTPEEMRLVVELAAELGFAAGAPVLAGHGSHARDLAHLSYADWLDGVRPALMAAAERGPVLVFGLSLGSLLAVELALAFPERILGLVLLSNAFFLSPFPAWPLRCVDKLGLPDFGVPKAYSDIGDPEARRTHLTYSAQPVRPAISLVRAADRLFERLPELRSPTLIVHGAKDRLCPVSNAWRVAERMGTPDVRVVVLPRSHHIVTRDFDREQLRSELRQFVRRLT